MAVVIKPPQTTTITVGGEQFAMADPCGTTITMMHTWPIMPPPPPPLPYYEDVFDQIFRDLARLHDCAPEGDTGGLQYGCIKSPDGTYRCCTCSLSASTAMSAIEKNIKLPRRYPPPQPPSQDKNG